MSRFSGDFGSFGGGGGHGGGHGGGGHGHGGHGFRGGFLGSGWYDGLYDEDDVILDVLDPEVTGGLIGPVLVQRRRLGW